MTDIINKLQAFADANPQSIAVRHTTDELTYQQLMDESSKLAHRLQGSKKPMILFGHMSPYMIVGMIGAIKAGCGYVPVDTSIPEDRIKMIINKVQPEFVFNTTDESFESLEGEVFTIEDIKTSQDPVIFDSQIKDNDTVYTIFTSGSTGEPKGVQIEYASLNEFAEWMVSLNKTGTGKEWLNQAPFSFDLSVFSIYPALVSGGMLKPLNKAVVQDFRQLFATLPALKLNVWVSTPSFMDICLMEPTFNGENVPELDMFLFCGEELTKKTAESLLDRFPNARIYNTYGPTEATVAISSIQIDQHVLDSYDRLPIGYVKKDTKVSIVQEGKPVSKGETGEIIIAGPSVSKGYLNNPEKTAAAFFCQNDLASYHTGDAGRLDEDGLLFYEGRMDQQVKLHGYRIELGDIEHYLLQDNRIKQAVVVPKYQGTKVQQLVAFVVLEDKTKQPDFQLTKSIKEQLLEVVMDYMIPQKFHYVDLLPQTVNGKIDRKKLTAEVNPE